MSENTLIVFVRKPALGKVKTRLAKTLGDGNALQIYLQLLSKTREVVYTFEGRVAVYYSEKSGELMDWGREVDTCIQNGDDLGDRMSQAMVKELSISNKVVLMGSDCPAITQDIIQQAFTSLDTVDTVIGPTEDGGYYLIGMKKNCVELFGDIPWSTSSVYSATLAKMAVSGYSVHKLPVLRDVDEEEDYMYYTRSGLLNIV